MRMIMMDLRLMFQHVPRMTLVCVFLIDYLIN